VTFCIRSGGHASEVLEFLVDVRHRVADAGALRGMTGMDFAWTDGDPFAAIPDATGPIVNDANGPGGMAMTGIFVYEIRGTEARQTGNAG